MILKEANIYNCWQQVSTDKQDIAYVRYNEESFMLELPETEINHHGAPRILDDDGNVVDPNYWKLPLYPDNEEHQKLIESLNEMDEHIESQFPKIFEKNAKKYFMTETVRVLKKMKMMKKRKQTPYLKLNLTQYSTGKLLTKIIDCW